MDPLVYYIPVHLTEAYRGKQIIVRAHDPAELVSTISRSPLHNVVYCQLLELDADLEPLADWSSVPLDLVMTRPSEELRLLYRFSSLLTNQAIRVSVPVTPGFSSAVRLAIALNFAVRLQVGQPDDDLVAELNDVLELYLHRLTVSQPVEFFHSSLLSFFHEAPSSLWSIQEEDPDQFCFVSDDGTESVPERLGGWTLGTDNRPPALEQQFDAKRVECDDCEFFNHCGGYFKWPNGEFGCAGIKTVFRTIREAARELQSDLSSVPIAEIGSA